MTTTQKAQLHFSEDAFELRTPSKHVDDVKTVKIDTSGRASIDLGINRESVLQDLPNFSVVTNLPARFV